MAGLAEDGPGCKARLCSHGWVREDRTWQSPCCPGAAWPQGPSGEVSQPLSAIQTLSPHDHLGPQSSWRLLPNQCPFAAQRLGSASRLWPLSVPTARERADPVRDSCSSVSARDCPFHPVRGTGGTAAAAYGAAGSAGSQNVERSGLAQGGDVDVGHEVLAFLAAHPDSLAILLGKGWS